MKKLKELSVKKSLIISICRGIISFLLIAIIMIFKFGVSGFEVTILFCFMVSISVSVTIFTVVFEAPEKIMNQRFQKKLEKILKYDGYTEIKPNSDECINITLDEKVKYYAKLIENNQVEVMICKDLEVSYEYVDCYQFKKFFSV